MYAALSVELSGPLPEMPHMYKAISFSGGVSFFISFFGAALPEMPHIYECLYLGTYAATC